MRQATIISFLLLLLFTACHKKPALEPQPEPVPVKEVVLTDSTLVPLAAGFEKELLRQGIDRSGKQDKKVRYGDVKDIDSLDLKLSFPVGKVNGIEYFTNLKWLRMEGSQTDSLDLSKNLKLEYLYCQTGVSIAGVPARLTYLNVNNCVQLHYLNCYNNLLTSVDLSQNPALKVLNLGLNPGLKQIDLSANANLEIADFSGCRKLQALDLSKNSRLTELTCTYASELSSLNVSMLTELSTLSAESCSKISELNLSANKKLTSLNISGTQLASIDLSLNPAIESLNCGITKFTSLDTSPLKELKSLQIYGSQIAKLNLSENKKLEWLEISASLLTEINLDNNRNLKSFYCTQQHYLSSVNLCNAPDLAYCVTIQSPALKTIYSSKIPTSADYNWQTNDWTKYVSCK